MRLLCLLVTGLAVLACAAPGVELGPRPGDFAFLQVDLQG